MNAPPRRVRLFGNVPPGVFFASALLVLVDLPVGSILEPLLQRTVHARFDRWLAGYMPILVLAYGLYRLKLWAYWTYITTHVVSLVLIGLVHAVHIPIYATSVIEQGSPWFLFVLSLVWLIYFQKPSVRAAFYRHAVAADNDRQPKG